MFGNRRNSNENEDRVRRGWDSSLGEDLSKTELIWGRQVERRPTGEAELSHSLVTHLSATSAECLHLDGKENPENPPSLHFTFQTNNQMLSRVAKKSLGN